jgi:plasmid maintenance system antidote protein VapI
MRVKSDEAMEVIRRELQAIISRGSKVTERDLLRLSAQTGIDYSTVLRIHQELS